MWGRGSGLNPLSSSQRKQNATRMVQGKFESHCAAEGREGEQDEEIYRNERHFLFSHSLPSCHFLFSTFSSGLHLTFCLSLCKHLLAGFLQNTAISNVCSSTSLTVFALSFSVSSLLVKLISLMMIILNMVKWLLSHLNQFFISLLSGTFRPLPCL